jgi:ATP-dependent DNA ligase
VETVTADETHRCRSYRHTAQFNRWRPDRDPRSSTYDQVERPLTFGLGDIVPGLD